MNQDQHARQQRTAVVLQHLAFEDLGIIEPLLTERGYTIRTVDLVSSPEARPDSVVGDLLVVLGGPIGVYEEEQYPFLRAEKRIVRDWLAAGRPALGVCLGAQLLAEVLGADVTPTGRKEIGFAPLTLTDTGRTSVLAPLAPPGEEPVPVLHWHGDEFAIPDGADRFAETPGFPNQAFALGDQVLGLQFHLEADHRRIEDWLVGHAHEIAASGLDPRSIRDDAERHGPRLERAATTVLGAWLDALGSGSAVTGRG